MCTKPFTHKVTIAMSLLIALRWCYLKSSGESRNRRLHTGHLTAIRPHALNFCLLLQLVAAYLDELIICRLFQCLVNCLTGCGAVAAPLWRWRQLLHASNCNFCGLVGVFVFPPATLAIHGAICG